MPSSRGRAPSARARDREAARELGFRAKRRFSQNFLVDEAMADRIADLTQVGSSDTVIEVGPGTGMLTGRLLERAGHVHAVELDRKLFSLLRVQYQAEPKLSLHEGDILKTRVRDMVPQERVVVVGNLPYAITSDLVLWMLDQHRDIRRAVVLMQREVALRLTAEPGERAAGSLTLAAAYRADSELILDVPPRCFQPVPRVISSLVAFRFLDAPRVHPRNEPLFFRVIRAAFGERRKTLGNALASGLSLPRDRVSGWIEEAGLDSRVRGERLSLEEFRRLADVLDTALGPDGEEDPGKGGETSRE